MDSWYNDWELTGHNSSTYLPKHHITPEGPVLISEMRHA